VPVAGQRSEDPRDADVVWPEDCTIVVLPLAQPRTREELDRARLGAAMLTPIAVAADVGVAALAIVASPLVLIYLLAGAGC
jgi:hypothetical protein